MIHQIYYNGHVKPDLGVDISVNDVKWATTLCNGFDVTGLTLYADLTFLSVLEGEKSHLETIFKAVKADPRLDNVQTIYSQNILRREFSGYNYGVWDHDFSEHVPESFLLTHQSFERALPRHPSPELGIFLKTFARVNNLPFAQNAA